MRKLSIDVVLHTLEKVYPDAGCTLDWTTPLDLLVATILSAQCTDKRVNTVTKSLFKKYRSPEDYLRVPTRELEDDIHSCGTFRMKTRAIQATCRTIIESFQGNVPTTMEGMLRLRGVGRKTAAVVLATAFGVVEGIPVDTHVLRVSQRLGITRGKNPTSIERELMRKTPQEEWAHLSHLLIFHGRTICHARSPKCDRCHFSHTCPSSYLLKKKVRTSLR